MNLPAIYSFTFHDQIQERGEKNKKDNTIKLLAFKQRNELTGEGMKVPPRKTERRVKRGRG